MSVLSRAAFRRPVLTCSVISQSHKVASACPPVHPTSVPHAHYGSNSSPNHDKSAKLSRSKRAKRRAQGALSQPDPKLPKVDHIGLSHNGIGAMDSNAHHGEGDRRSWRSPYISSSQQSWRPSTYASHNAQTPTSQHASGYSPYTAPPPQHPVGNTPVASQMNFGPFNAYSWMTPTSNYPSTSVQPTMPMLDPRHFAAIAGNFPSQFPMMPMNNMAPLQGVRPMSTMAEPARPARNAQRISPRPRMPTPPMDIPIVSTKYKQQASQKPQKCDSPRPLLVILDLNGTLIYRKHKRLPPSFASRAGLDQFLDILTKKYAVMIWSSSKPATVEAVCAKLFTKNKKRRLVALWGRDKFGLSKVQYNAKLQVYKELDKVWSNSDVQSTYPGNEALKSEGNQQQPNEKQTNKQKQDHRELAASFPEGQRWDQSNTILIDDSKLKALSEPYNILEIPEFTNDPNIDESMLFTKVLARLDTLSRHDDVSKMLREWNEFADQQKTTVLDLDLSPDEADEEEGGISLLQPPTEPEAIRLRKEEKKLRGKEKKVAKKAAKEAAKEASKEASKEKEAARQAAAAAREVPAMTERPSASVSASTSIPAPISPSPQNQPTNPQNNPSTTANISRRKKGKGKGKKQDPYPPAQDHPPIDPSIPRYTFRTRRQPHQFQDVAEPQSSQFTPINPPTSEALPGSVDVNANAIEDVPVPDISIERRRSPSPATSSASGNSLLDRLEDGLGLRR
ncbi:hypothetical protein PENSTE_c011G04533 [Penicillium steckii]|uniref:FCP1 homology domain-containing protein n=1 Tax=Penicillium steckii TaxID=303698 RepID=A0A1V6T761_9EURO|nr:hypothetical protein PENSTE_c011G04533 [Penicillium steckii]